MSIVLDMYGNPIAKPKKDASQQARDLRRQLKARYDAAQTTIENETHWSYADNLSANASNTPEVRRKLRDRSRYEYANNSYYKGMMLTRAQYLISTGPHLDVLFTKGTVEETQPLANEIEARWREWVDRTRFNEKLSAACVALAVDGESFMVEINNDLLPADEVQLDYRLYEAEHIAGEELKGMSPNYVDGVFLDENGYPIAYDLLKYHPGDMFFGFSSLNLIEKLPSSKVIHLFRVDRPGQARGIPWITPALPMFAQFRRFTLATLTAAEAAANAAGVVYTDSSALMADDIQMPDEDIFNMPRGSFPVMPAGWKMEQMNPEHPATTFEMFRRGILSEIARCLSMPLNIAVANSENHNYASGRLDHQVFHKSMQVERDWLRTIALDRVFYKWLDEALMIPGYLPRGITNMGLQSSWYWDGMPHVDPQKEATASIDLWQAGLITDNDYWLGVMGVDPAKQYEKLRRQQSAREEIGLPLPGDMQEPALVPGVPNEA